MARGDMKTRDFVFLCEELTLRKLPPGFPDSQRKVMWTILQLAYGGDPNIHFELQPNMGRRAVELGLHFEADPERNAAWAHAIALEGDELASALGPEWELEDWTSSWWRLHRVYHFEVLSAEFAEEVAAEFARALAILVPLVERFSRNGLPETALARPLSAR